jgi:hypothetical protein
VFPILITLLSKGGDRLRELLGEGQEVLDFPTKLLKPASGLMGGSTDVLFANFLYVPSFPSRTSMHSLTHPLIHPPLCLSLGGETNC